jgi:phosphopantothenoylcysteine synthetase/decarboxylase
MLGQACGDQNGRMRDDALSIVVCGSSAATGLPAYLAYLNHELDLSLRILLTHSAERFFPRQAASWYADEVYASDDPALNPTEFARRSLAIVVLPATANMLGAAALGLAGTPAQTIMLAAEGPALFFPSMNATMWAKRTTQGHVAALREDGHTVVEPREQQVYEMWRRDFALGPALSPPLEATETIISWLDGELAARAMNLQPADAVVTAAS